MNYQIAFSLVVALTLGVSFLNLPPVINTLMELYGVSYSGISVLLSALLWSHLAMQIPAGVIADRLGVRPTLFFGLGCMTVGNFLPALWPSLALAITGRVMTGVGTGLAFVTAMKLVALYAPRHNVGAFQGYYGGFFSIGSILAYLLIPLLVPLGWRWPYLVAGLTSLGALVMMLGLRVAPSSASPSGLLILHPLRQIIASPIAWVIGIYHALSWGSMLNLGNWVPSALAEVWGGGSAAQLAWGGAVVMGVSGLGRLSGGLVLARFSPRAVANGSILALFVVFLGLSLIPVPALTLLLMLAAAWFSSVNFGALFHLAGQAAPTVSLATLFGFVNLLANVGAVFFTLGFGLVKDQFGSFTWGFGLLSLLAVSGFLIGQRVLARERRPIAAIE